MLQHLQIVDQHFSVKHKEFIYKLNTFGNSFEKCRGKLFQEIYELRKESKNEKNTMNLLCNIANHIEPMIQFTYDIPGSYNDNKLGMPSKKNSKIWDIGPKGGRGSSLNPKFFSYFNWDKYCRREGVKRSLSQNNTINFCSPYSSFMDFRII